MPRKQNKVIFDLNSKNTFNNWFGNNWKFKEPFNKEDYWVTKRFYSIGQTEPWSLVINTYVGHPHTDINLNLACGHIKHISSLTFYAHSNKKTNIYVSCKECGGTGEIRIV